jgi:hypothetical protein
MTFDALERIADAVLYEGYLLYPYTARSAKNQVRWQFGVIAPRAPAADAEPWYSQTECLIEAAPAASLHVRVRGLRPVPRPAAAGETRQVGERRAVDLGPFELAAPGTPYDGPLPGLDLDVRGRVDLEPAGRWWRLRVRLENAEPWDDRFGGDRERMLGRSLVAAHVLLAVTGGEFISLLDPGPAAAAAAACVNLHTWPVLAGLSGRRDRMLSSPIVLYDHPGVAAQSRGDLHDAAEIEEILSLRILALSGPEKDEARAADPRARAIVDRVDALTAEALWDLHGTMREVADGDAADLERAGAATVDVAGVPIGPGARVRLQPQRRADAMDMFLAGQPATVAAVERDLDGRTYVAVTVDADPGAAQHHEYGRFFYFMPDELEPLAPAVPPHAPDAAQEPR